MHSKLQNIIFDLLSYKYLEDNWDGYDGLAPEEKTIRSAWRLLKVLVDNNIYVHNVMVSGDSEISFYWKENGKYYVELECYFKDGKEQLGWIVDTKDKEKYDMETNGGEDVPLDDFKTTKVFEFLKKYQPPLDTTLKQNDLYYFNLFSSKETK